MAAYDFVKARRAFHRPAVVGVDYGLGTLVVASCFSDVTAETASAVCGWSVPFWSGQCSGSLHCKCRRVAGFSPQRGN